MFYRCRTRGQLDADQHHFNGSGLVRVGLPEAECQAYETTRDNSSNQFTICSLPFVVYYLFNRYITTVKLELKTTYLKKTTILRSCFQLNEFTSEERPPVSNVTNIGLTIFDYKVLLFI